jgi:hypothetical protein
MIMAALKASFAAQAAMIMDSEQRSGPGKPTDGRPTRRLQDCPDHRTQVSGP